MRVRLFLLILVTVKTSIPAERNTFCLTPNGQNGTCVPATACKINVNVTKTQYDNTTKFAQQLQCNSDNEPLVCCGSSDSSTSTASFKYTESFLTDELKQHPRKNKLSDYKTDTLPDRTVCGLERERPKIKGGSITDIDEFPWTVAIESRRTVYPFDLAVRCGGSLINNRFVLTAAHCLTSKEFNVTTVLLGEWNLLTDPDCLNLKTVNLECADLVQKIRVKEIIPHSYYRAQVLDNDLGLIRLEKDVAYTSMYVEVLQLIIILTSISNKTYNYAPDYIRPICLPLSNISPPELGTVMTVTGWGVTHNGTTSDIKMKLDIPLLANQICKEKLRTRRILSPNQLCAGGEQGKDACQGDSGGPLMRTYSDNVQPQWYLEGVVSWGIGCARFGLPGVYTRVNRYINWILDTMGEYSE